MNDNILTLQDLKEMKPDTVFAKDVAFIEHPWFNQARNSLELNGQSKLTKVKWIAKRGAYHDWAIYHSLDANLEPADYLDGTTHLHASWEMILRGGAKLTKEKDIRYLCPCDDEAFKMYRY